MLDVLLQLRDCGAECWCRGQSDGLNDAPRQQYAGGMRLVDAIELQAAE